MEQVTNSSLSIQLNNCHIHTRLLTNLSDRAFLSFTPAGAHAALWRAFRLSTILSNEARQFSQQYFGTGQGGNYYGIFHKRSNCTANPCNRPRCRSRYLGRYAEYRQIRKEKEELLIAKRTVETILNIDRQKEQEKEKEKEEKKNFR